MAGGNGIPKSPEHRQKIAEKLRAYWANPENREKAQQVRGDRHPNHGKKAGAETLEKKRQWMLENAPNRGKTPHEEWRRKLSESHTGKAPRLRRYGITDQQYSSELAAGNRWCFYRKHFAQADSFRGTKSVCGDCRSEHSRKGELAKKFGVTQEWYASKLAEQGSFCAICGVGRPSKGNKHLCVDHDHQTNKVRGLLCSRCNAALERLDSVPDWAPLALAYLQKYS